MRFLKNILLALTATAACTGLSGCLVMGYSTGGGWWVWPGSLVVSLVLILMWLLTRR